MEAKQIKREASIKTMTYREKTLASGCYETGFQFTPDGFPKRATLKTFSRAIKALHCVLGTSLQDNGGKVAVVKILHCTKKIVNMQSQCSEAK
jgi:hypothetical protein